MAFSIRRIARHALLFRSLIIRFYAYFFGLFLFYFAEAFVAMRLLARLVFMCMQIKKFCASDFARFFTLGRIFFRRHQFKGATVYLTI